jgi:PAS domain S-box-containing protein
MTQTTTQNELRILLLEDSPDDAELTEHELRKARMNFTLKRVESRESFGYALDDFLPDIVLSDFNLPSFSGLAALNMLLRSYPETPLIIVTGALSDREAVELLQAGAKDYVLKDRLARLVPAIKHALLVAQKTKVIKLAEAQLLEKTQLLEKNNQFFTTLAQISPVGIFRTDKRGGCTYFNECWSLITGLTSDKALGAGWAHTIHPEDREKVEQAWYTSAQAHHNFIMEYRIQRPNGETRRVLGQASAERDVAGEVIGYVGTITDITQSKQNEEELQRFFNLVPDLVCIASSDGHFQKINVAWQELLGYTVREILAKPFLDLIHPDDRDATMKEVERQLAGEATLQFTNRYRCKDGSYKWLEWKATPAVDKKLLFASARDITERKQAEAKIQRLTQLYAALSQCNQAIVHCTGEDELFQLVCRNTVQFGGFKMAWVAILDPDTRIVKPVASFGAGAGEYLQDIEISADADSPFGRGPTGTAIRENRPVWCQDFPNDPATAPWHERGARFGWGSSTSLPLHRNGTVIGAFSIYSNETNAYDEAARDLLLEMASDISYALNNFAREAERKKTTDDLANERQLLTALLDNIGEAVVACDGQGIITRFNKAARTLHGLPEQSISPEQWAEHYDLYQADGITPLRKEEIPLFRVLQGEHVRDVEMMVIPKHATAHSLIANGQAMHDSNGKLLGAVIAMHDITGRKQTENEIKLQRDNFMRILNAMTDGIYVVSRSCDIEYVNPVIERDFGKVEGRKCYTYFHGRTEVCPWCKNDDVFKGNSVRWEWHSDKTGKDYDLFDTPITNPDGSVSKFEIFHDITERKTAEEAMARYARDMGERVKEISCLRDITLLSNNDELGVDRILDGCVRRMLAGWLDPSRTCARIRLNDRTFETPNFHETEWKLAAEIPFATENSGAVEVFYMGGEAEEIKNPFLDEEHDLIKSIALQLALALESRWAEKKLYQLNRDFVLFLENTTDFIYFKDENSRFRFCSQTLANITGHTSWRDMIGKHDLEVFPKDTAQIYYEEELPIFREGKPLLNKIDPYYDAQGAEGWVSTNKWPVFDEEGKKVVGIFGISRDITAYQKNVNALTRSEQHFRAFFERSMVGMAETSPEKGWVKVNDRLCEMLGYSREELARMTWAELTHPDDLAADVAQFNRVLAGDIDEYTLDKRFIHRDGHVVYTYLALRCVRREEGAVDYFVALVEDITERKLAEIALLASEQNLLEAQQQAHIGSWELNPVSNQHVWSEEMYRIFGISPEQLGTNYSAFLDTLHPDDRDMVSRAYAASLSDGPPYDVEYRFIRKSDGQLRWGHARCEHERDANGKALRSFGTVQDITERKQAEASLRESEGKFRIAQDISPDGFTILRPVRDAQGRAVDFIWVYENAAIARLNGTDPEAVVGKRLLELFPGHRDTPILRAYQQVADSGETCIFEADYSDESMSKPTSFRLVVVPMAENIAILAQDVTEHKRAEESLRSASQYARSLIEASLDPLVTISAEGKITDVNTATENVTGVNRRGLIGSDFVNYFTDPEKAHEGYQQVFQQGFVTDYPLAIRHVSGKITDVLYNASLYRDSNGNVLGVFAAARDITERKQAEDELRKLSVAVEQSPASVVITDTKACIQYVNSRFTEVSGYSAAEAIGQNPHILQSGQTPKETYQELWGKLTSGEPWHGELLNKRKSGELYWEDVSIAPVKNPAGRVTHYVAVKADITARKEFEAELLHSNAELEQFSYAVSHDMRQPLRMISSYLQLIELGLADQLVGEKRDYFNYAIDGAKRIDQMLVALLEYSRVGRMGEPPTWIESRAALDEALLFLQPAIAEAQAKLTISGDWPRVFASHDEMLRLLQNLIGNAAKYRIAGRIPEITVTSEVANNEWRICIADNGVGIFPNQIKRLFKVFQRLHSRDVYEGTGIGLALCRKIAEHHKGRIWAESEGDGQGSKFCVVLPCVERGK